MFLTKARLCSFFVYAVLSDGLVSILCHASVQTAEKPSYWVGNNMAAALWDKNQYDCTFDSVITTFWEDVKDEVYSSCEQLYSFFSESEKECRVGAEDYSMKVASSCLNDADCESFGALVAYGIAAKYCPRRDLTAANRDGRLLQQMKVSSACQFIARKTSCKKSIVGLVQNLVTRGLCEDVKLPLSSEVKSQLKKECGNAATDLISEATMP